jgi:hypothetical protein
MSSEQKPFDPFLEGTYEKETAVRRRLGIPPEEPLRRSHLAQYKEMQQESPARSPTSPSYTPRVSPEPEAYPVHLCPPWEVHPYMLATIEAQVRQALDIQKGQPVTRSHLDTYNKQQMAKYREEKTRPPSGVCSPTHSPPRSPTYSPSASRYPRQYAQEEHPLKLAKRKWTEMAH